MTVVREDETKKVQRVIKLNDFTIIIRFYSWTELFVIVLLTFPIWVRADAGSE